MIVVVVLIRSITTERRTRLVWEVLSFVNRGGFSKGLNDRCSENRIGWIAEVVGGWIACSPVGFKTVARRGSGVDPIVFWGLGAGAVTFGSLGAGAVVF